MRKYLILLVITITAFALSACSSPSDQSPNSKIPDKPSAEAPAVMASDYANTYGGYVFRVGGGTVWCTISGQPNFVICEHREVDVTYQLPSAPASCEGAWGYQAKLWAFQPSEGKIADWYCSSGLYSDPEGIYDLPVGSKITVGGITCYASEQVARCDNETGQYLVLGSEVYAFGN
ncbi:MAG: hypothetical protein EBR26_07050 [Microbacteriaceae bacterium]|nr:hypothetical protein [Microbacteriaceae bacterium]